MSNTLKVAASTALGSVIGLMETARPSIERDEIAFRPGGGYDRYVSGKIGGLGETLARAATGAAILGAATLLFKGGLPLDQLPLIGDYLTTFGSAATLGAMIGAGFVAAKNTIKGAVLGFLSGRGDDVADQELAAMALGGTAVEFIPLSFAIEQSLHAAVQENKRTGAPATADIQGAIEKTIESQSSAK